MVPPKKHKPCGDKTPAETANSKEQLLKAGMKLFAKNGLEGTTVRDIAQQAGTNICMVSYHFDGKEGLYRACLEEYGKARLEGNKGLVTPARSLEEFKVRVRLLATSMLTAHIENREISELLGKEIDKDFPVARDIFESTFLQSFKDVLQFFESAQKSGFIRQDLDVLCLVNIFYGAVKNCMKMDVISSRYFNHSVMNPKGFEKFMDTWMSIFFEGILA